MNPRQKTIIGISIAVVVLLALVGAIARKEKGATHQDVGREEDGALEGKEIFFTPDVPEYVELSKPVHETKDEEGGKAALGIFEVTMTEEGFQPNVIAARQGDIAQILLRAIDGDYDFAIPALGMRRVVEKGTEKLLSFQATDSGTLLFLCRDACPRSGGSGKIVILPKE